ncbi:MAG: hypothetical protein N4A33_05895 [Bacteriovoracaceae bacterium]|jgi:hypothetical protein|nr:hypothetical protein [Bacteriovoracaceae bacterium]
MKLSKKLIGGLSALLVTTSLYAHKGGGGGHVIEVNGKVELLDIVSQGTCDWQSGESLINANPYINTMLEKIRKLDWYLALELEHEIKYISWCKTGKLYSVPAADDDSFVQQISDGVQQAAFRYNESAYLDKNIFDQLSDKSKAYLIFHETLHSYLGMSLEMRQFKLMTLVSTLRKVDLGQIENRETLHLNLKRSSMNFPLTVNELSPMQDQIEFALSNLKDRKKMFLSVNKPEELISEKIFEIIPFISSWDVEAITNYQQAFSETIRSILMDGREDEVNLIFESQVFVATNPAGIALKRFFTLSEKVQEKVVSSIYFNKIIQDGFNSIKTIDLSIKNNRIAGDRVLQSLTMNAKELKVKYLVDLQTGVAELPVQLQMMAKMISVLAKDNRFEKIEEKFAKNKVFKDAISLAPVFEKLEALDSPIQREKKLAKLVLNKIKSSLKQQLKQTVKNDLSVDKYEKIMTILKEVL